MRGVRMNVQALREHAHVQVGVDERAQRLTEHPAAGAILVQERAHPWIDQSPRGVVGAQRQILKRRQAR